MEEPDYDDLIEDYMEEFEEPPPAAAVPEYDEDFLAEVEAAAEAAENNGERNTSTTTPTGPDDEDHQSPISRDLGGRLAAASPPRETNHLREEEASSPPAQVRHDFASSRSREGSSPPDIYSFERYNRNASWRQDNQTSPSTMRAREWKTKASQIISNLNNSESRSKNKQTTPEAQLLHYNTCQRRPLSKNVIARNDPNMSLQPIEGQASVSMTLSDGNRVFVRQVEAKELSTSSRSPPSESTFSLGISMTDLLRRVQAMRRKKEHDQLKVLSKQLKQQRKKLSAATTTGEEEEDDDVMEEEEPEADEPQSTPDDQLWVDKHAPSTFANLLSDERTNREVLRALREWDPYVFKKDPPPRPKFGHQQDKEEDQDQANMNPNDKRPKEKNRVILLSGSPGVGKTTLAHILARHCGYRPLEVNGSDERSGSALTGRVVRAMETATLDMKRGGDGHDWKGRPNCVIIDEIDGADAKQALKALVELIRQDMPTSKSSTEGKRRSNKPYLKRPIIFICNNLYAPALRPLLPVARVFRVEAPGAPRLVARLRAVLSAEGLSLWGGTRLLHELVSASGGDIRSCLYTLQFAAAQVHQQQQHNKGQDISKTLQSSLNGDGLKDDRNDVAGTTMAVFRKVKNKGKLDRLWGTRQMSDPRTSVERVFDAVESFGEHTKILNTMYLNLLNVSYIDPTFDRCAAALNWLSAADNRSVQHVFTPCVAAALHLLCRVEQKPDLTYTTRELSDNHFQLEANLGLANKFSDGLSVSYRGSRSADAIIRDTIPYSLWMLSAGEGSSALSRAATSVDILNKLEQVSFQNHIATLRSLGISYVPFVDHDQGYQDQTISPQTMMVLEPPIDRLVQFQDLNHTTSSMKKDIPTAMKELLAQQASLQGIRDRKTTSPVKPQKALGSKASESTMKVDTPFQTNINKTNVATEVGKSLESPLKPLVTPQTNNGKITRRESSKTEFKEEERPAKRQKAATSSQNFLLLGAKRSKSVKRSKNNVGFVRSVNKKSNTGSGVPFRQVLRLKYVKGFTQAVRNPCRLEDLA